MPLVCVAGPGSRHYVASGGGGEGALFHDDFASGDRTHAENGIAWSGSHNTSVVADVGNASGYALQFWFSDPESGSSYAEQRFNLDTLNLGTLYTELWIKYRFVVPANYQHPDGPSSDNNKWIRLWSGDKTDGNSGYGQYYIKNGYSLVPENNAALESRLIYEFGKRKSDGNLSGIGEFDSYNVPMDTYISEDLYGEEIEVVMHFKVDTSGPNDTTQPNYQGGNGIQRIWRDGILMGNLTTISNRPGPSYSNGYNFGYLMGADNSDFHGGTESTYFYVREIWISETNIFGVS
jgi:hypothetical protein